MSSQHSSHLVTKTVGSSELCTWEQYTITYIQYNQDWIGIRKIQVQNDYIQQTVLAQKGIIYSHLGN